MIEKTKTYWHDLGGYVILLSTALILGLFYMLGIARVIFYILPKLALESEQAVPIIVVTTILTAFVLLICVLFNFEKFSDITFRWLQPLCHKMGTKIP